MRFLIVGLGSIGRRHAANIKKLRDDAELIFVRRKPDHDAFSRSLGAQLVATLDAGLAMSPSAAVIATPSALHHEALSALIAGKIPCYVEKPIVTTLDHVSHIRELASRHGHLPHLAGFNLRYLPSLHTVRSLIRNGSIGNVARVSLCAGQWLPDWRPGDDYRNSYSASDDLGGGVVMDLSHEIDMARWFLGEIDIVAAASAHRSDLDIKTEDVALILGTAKNGPIVSIALDYVSRRPVRRYEFVGDRGTLTWDLPERSIRIARADGIEVVESDPSSFDVAGTYPAAIQTFLNGLDGVSSDNAQDLEDGLMSTELAILARQRAASA